jgi:hypothetical protein
MAALISSFSSLSLIENQDWVKEEKPTGHANPSPAEADFLAVDAKNSDSESNRPGLLPCSAGVSPLWSRSRASKSIESRPMGSCLDQFDCRRFLTAHGPKPISW